MDAMDTLFPSAPLCYSFELTFACNNLCPGCANVLESRRDEFMTEWKFLLDRIAPSENRTKYAELIRISGGEPTLHPDFQQIIEYIDSFALPHVTFTNGRWPHPEKVLDTFKVCSHFWGLLMSLHGSDALSHKAFMGDIPGAFEETCANIKRASESGLAVFTNTVLTKYNCEQIEQLIELSQRLGAHCAVFNRYLGNVHPIEPSEAELRQAILTIEGLQEQGEACHLGDCVPPCFVKNSSIGSNGGIELCAISPSGEVRPENLTRYSFGNLFESAIEEIWQSEEAQWYRKQLPAQCEACVELDRCRGGVRAVTIEHDLIGDRLMGEAILESEPDTFEFDPDWKVIPNFRLRERQGGYLLCRINWSIPIAHDAKPFIDALNGERTLGQLHERFGDNILELIGELYKQDFIDFEDGE